MERVGFQNFVDDEACLEEGNCLGVTAPIIKVLSSTDIEDCCCVEVYGPVNPMGSCRVQPVYLTTRLLGRLSPLSG